MINRALYESQLLNIDTRGMKFLCDIHYQYDAEYTSTKTVGAIYDQFKEYVTTMATSSCNAFNDFTTNILVAVPRLVLSRSYEDDDPMSGEFHALLHIGFYSSMMEENMIKLKNPQAYDMVLRDIPNLNMFRLEKHMYTHFGRIKQNYDN